MLTCAHSEFPMAHNKCINNGRLRKDSTQTKSIKRFQKISTACTLLTAFTTSWKQGRGRRWSVLLVARSTGAKANHPHFGKWTRTTSLWAAASSTIKLRSVAILWLGHGWRIVAQGCRFDWHALFVLSWAEIGKFSFDGRVGRVLLQHNNLLLVVSFRLLSWCSI